MLTVDIPALAEHAKHLLGLILVTPPKVETRAWDFAANYEQVGDAGYLVIDGASFEVIPVKGTAKSIAGEVEVLKWKVNVVTDVATREDHLAAPDVQEHDADSFHDALVIVATLWTMDQLSGHSQAMFEAEVDDLINPPSA